MKVEIILATILMSLSIGERQQRSTVLTDESKRILEHFDFSNFDKQEALNYLDRQRYENQIRGKRSQAKFKRDQNEKDSIQPNDLEKKIESEIEPELEPEQGPGPEPEVELDPEQLESDTENSIEENDPPQELMSEVEAEPEPEQETETESEPISTASLNQNSNVKNAAMEGRDLTDSQTNRKPNPNTFVAPSNNASTKFRSNDKRNKRGRNKKKKKVDVARYTNEEEYGEQEDVHLENQDSKRHRKRKKKKKKRHYWDHWSEWSPCSVTCGRGRKIRWRKCIAKSCTNGELEMGEKTCQLPACNLLTKLLGLK